MTTIVIGKDITTVGDNSFWGCSSMKDFYCYAEQFPKPIRDPWTTSYVKQATLHIPQRLIDEYKDKYYPARWSSFGNIVPLTDSDPKPTGIIAVNNEMTTDKLYYSLDGKRITQPQQGLNILRMSNGKTKKVVVK